jgi:hypothetical protein
LPDCYLLIGLYFIQTEAGNGCLFAEWDSKLSRKEADAVTEGLEAAIP